MKSRLLILCAAMALILACVPGLATPPPPADSNAISLYIQQTAAAALTQTQAAMPPPTITRTPTSTPRSTFTPEPTFTPFQTFVLASPKPAQKIQYFRVKHDSQLAIWNYRSRTISEGWELFPQTPETVPLLAAPKEGSGTHRTPLVGSWASYIDALNNHEEGKLVYLKSDSTALFNGSGFPQLESLTMGGNIITLEAIQGTWGKVHTMDFGNPGAHAADTYVSRPDLVHKFVVVGWSRKSKATFWVKPPKGNLYWPFVSAHDLWIQMDRLEPFPILPMEVTANEDQDVRVDPKFDSPSNKLRLSKGGSATIDKYYPSGSNVWARLQSGGWILLFSYEKGVPTYHTSWSMATLPPPPD